MKNIAVICEYNPLHMGHKYHIERIKSDFEGAGVVAIMSGDFVQRGDAAVFEKYTRAKAAVAAGADLVVELPFPYSCASAEYFARAGVYIADALGVCSALSFGSESGDVRELEICAGALLSKEYTDKMKEAAKKDKSAGYMKLSFDVISDILGESHAKNASLPNNILGIEYIKAIRTLGSRLEPHTVRRRGDGYNDDGGMGEFVSAAYLRRLLSEEKSISRFVPDECEKIYRKALQNGETADFYRLEKAVLSFFRLADPHELSRYAGAAGGLGYRLCSAAKESASIGDFFAAVATKKYTNARIRRAVISCMLSVQESEYRAAPAYTNMLAANAAGLEILREMKKKSRIPVITKPADYRKESEPVKKACELAARAHSLYTLSFEKAIGRKSYFAGTPYICIN